MNNMETVVLADYDNIKVNRYLTYAEIQTIADMCKTCKTWSEIEQTADFGIMVCATNLSEEKIKTIGHDKLLCSGTIDAVKKQIVNLSQLRDALDFGRSLMQVIYNLSKELPALNDKIEAIKNGSNI